MNISNCSCDLEWLQGDTTNVTNAHTYQFLPSVWLSSRSNFDLRPFTIEFYRKKFYRKNLSDQSVWVWSPVFLCMSSNHFFLLFSLSLSLSLSLSPPPPPQPSHHKIKKAEKINATLRGRLCSLNKDICVTGEATRQGVAECQSLQEGGCFDDRFLVDFHFLHPFIKKREGKDLG